MILLDHLVAGAAIFAALLVLLLAYGIGRKVEARRAHARRVRNGRWPKGVPVIRLDWVGEIPVATLECDAELTPAVAAWLDAVKEGTVLRA